MSTRRRFAHANGDHKPAPEIEVTDARTDITRWRLRNIRGRQTWHYLYTDEELKAWPMTAADKYYLGLDTVRNMKLGSMAIANEIGGT